MKDIIDMAMGELRTEIDNGIMRAVQNVGERHTIGEWAEIVGINRSTLNNRYYKGWSVERMLTVPVVGGNQYTLFKAEREMKKCHVI